MSNKTGYENGDLVNISDADDIESITDEQIIHDYLSEGFDYDSVDGNSLLVEKAKERIEALIKTRAEEEVLDALNWIFSQYFSTIKRQKFMMQGAAAINHTGLLGETDTSLAGKLGISKQEFTEGKLAIIKRLRLSKTRGQKTALATKEYSLTNHRNNKPK